MEKYRETSLWPAAQGDVFLPLNGENHLYSYRYKRRLLITFGNLLFTSWKMKICVKHYKRLRKGWVWTGRKSNLLLHVLFIHLHIYSLFYLLQLPAVYLLLWAFHYCIYFISVMFCQLFFFKFNYLFILVTSCWSSFCLLMLKINKSFF